MSDVSAELIEKAAKVLLADYSSEYANDFDWTEFADQARRVLGALDLPGLLNAAKAEALREAADEMPFGYSHPAYLLRARADRIDPDEGAAMSPRASRPRPFRPL